MLMKRGKQVRWMLGSLVVVMLALAMPMATLAAGGPPDSRGSGRGGQGGYGMGEGTGLPVATGTLTAEQEAALVEALEEEYGAVALYESVMDAYGTVQPFASIAQSEQTHVNALLNIFERYGVTAPAAPAATDLPSFDTLEDACATGVDAEIVDGALYDELMPLFDQPDVLRVFENLQRASLESHLPAFEACEDGVVCEDCDGIGSGVSAGAGAGGWGGATADRPAQGGRGRGGAAGSAGTGAAYRDGSYCGR